MGGYIGEITITKPITRYMTRYHTKLVGVITRWYRVRYERSKDGSLIPVTEVVDAITVPYNPKGKAVLIDTGKLKRALKKITVE